MVRRRSTVRFRNGAQVDDLIRKDSNGSWMPVGTNGCHQGTESPATASPERPYPHGIWGYPEQPVRSRIPSQPTDQSAGQARTGTGAARSRDCLDAPGDNSPGKSSRAPRRDGQARSAPAWCRDHVSGPGAADRLGLDPGLPGGTGQAATVTAAAAGPVAARVLAAAAAASGQCRAPVSYLRVRMTCSRLGPGWPGASPVIRRHSRACSCGPAGGSRGLSPGRSLGSWAPNLLPST
jgi:hypothetical protein